jgi:hypothetical protein
VTRRRTWRDWLRATAVFRLWYDADATFVGRPPIDAGHLGRRQIAARVAAFLIMALAIFLIASPRRQPAPSVLPPPDFSAPAAAEFPQASEAALLAAPTQRLSIWQARAAPAVLVLIFPSDHAQAVTLNRVAAFVEKAGLPRGRVLDDTALDAAIGASHQEFDTYYYGHDYRGADLARFFKTAATDRIALRPEERVLHDLLAEAGFLVPGANRALISLPPKGTGVQDASGRHAILIHELSHGLYFTDPRYAALVQEFWRNTMTGAERSAFRQFLGAQGYDTGNDDLMANEMQAYLVFTPDRRFFRPSVLGLDVAEVARLQAAFMALLPAGWLRDNASAIQ